MGFTPTFKYYPSKTGDPVGYTMTLTPQHGPGMRAKWLHHVGEGKLKMEWKIPESFPTAKDLNNEEYLEHRLQSRPTN